MAATDFDFALYAQILRALMPRARGIYLYARNGDLAWSSEGADYNDLRPTVEGLLHEARRGAAPDHRGRLVMIDEVPAWCFLLRGEDRDAVAALVILGRPVTRTDDLPPLESVERTLAPLIELARRELSAPAARSAPDAPSGAARAMAVPAGPAETGRHTVADTQELQWLFDVVLHDAGGPGTDELQSLLGAFAERAECDIAVLHAPGVRIDRTVIRHPAAGRDVDLLRGVVERHLYRVAKLQGRTLIVNKVREDGAGGMVPYRILCVPLARRGVVTGVAAGFNRADGRPFEARDARILERLAPRLQEIVDVQFDAGTGLLTRYAFEEQALARIAAQPATSRAVVYCDVDQMHIVNDLYGFAAGDALLRAVGETWRTRERPPGSLAARLDGDRFVALLEDVDGDRGRAWALEARDAIAKLAPPERGAAHRVSASLGVAAIETGRNLEHALVAAHTACNTAKDRGRSRVEVWSATDAGLVQRQEDLRVYHDLVDAFERDRFRLYAQPIVPLWDPTLGTRYEVLVRLLDAQQQAVAPDRFLAAAHRYQLLARLDGWVLEALLGELAKHRTWLAAACTTFAVNVSAQTLASPEYLESVRGALATAGLPPGTLGFELAEGPARARLADAERFAQRARELGCTVTIDNFGSGASSLAYLKSLPVTALKIDGLYVRDLLTNARSESMVRAILHIARQLDLDTVAECVESPEIAAHLATLGVVYGQGYAFAAPRPLADVLDEVTRRAPPRLTEAVVRGSRRDDGTPVH